MVNTLNIHGNNLNDMLTAENCFCH